MVNNLLIREDVSDQPSVTGKQLMTPLRTEKIVAQLQALLKFIGRTLKHMIARDDMWSSKYDHG